MLPPIQPRTRRAVDKALRIIAQLVERGCTVIGVEQKVYASADVWGTLDVLLYDAHNDFLIVLDYKNGVVPVCAEDNLQLMCYAWGAWLKYASQYPVNRVCMGIIQPNSRDNKTFTTDIKYVCELFDFSLYLQECVTVATRPDAPLRGGDWCYWCKIVHRCPVAQKAQQRRQKSAALAPHQLSNINQIMKSKWPNK